MKPVATPWYKLYKPILFGFGIPFTLIGFVFLYIDGNLAFLVNGVLWVMFGCALKIKGDYNQRKLQTLKRKGLCYDCSVAHIVPVHWVRIGSYVTARVECVYKTEKGECLIKNGYYLLSPLDRIENLYAKIYFDCNNLDKCVVELFQGDNELVFKS